MYGPYHIITYLQKLNKTEFKLVLEYSVWVIEHYPEESLEVNISLQIHIYIHIEIFILIFFYLYFKIINK